MEPRSGTTNATSDAMIDFAFYRYDPSMAGAVIFVILFSITTIWHAFQLVHTRTWFFIPFLMGGIFEIIGYVGRAMSSSQSPNWTLGPYLLQTLFLLLAPALLAASVYMLLGRIILILRAESHAMLRKKWLTKVFVTGDVLSFFLQGGGGGIQSSGGLDGMKLGQKIIVAGLLVQILFFGFFIVTASSFDMKLKRYPIPRCFDGQIPWRKHLNILYVTSILILVRSVFRLVEYLQGNDGFLLHHEIYLYIFDAVLIFIAMAVFNLFHPSEIAQYMDLKEDLELSEGYGNLVSIKMQFTIQALSVLAASLFFSTASAAPQCQPGAAWPDVHDCHNFFECAAGGIPVLKTCGPGTAYCPQTGVCDYEFKIPACHPHGPPPEAPGAEGEEHPTGAEGNPFAGGRPGAEDEDDEYPKGAEGNSFGGGRPGAESQEYPKGAEGNAIAGGFPGGMGGAASHGGPGAMGH
ncbi:uncharacterized protein CDV56_107079 [Aspergillus thermomutatus]|uniref:Chitin-binding type-2 domain-containing protein n=1 Tax=Aspergillus thermomutatus TaxID=41047 RepID=A0A397HMY2_ASPTH|nr:uncharacterized protein CDV56_107079 [Aspergillus thermomutatus]RHZ61810.1 hypothetical protein CDV56_107079 [Aspergillus thermomutatus]